MNSCRSFFSRLVSVLMLCLSLFVAGCGTTSASPATQNSTLPALSLDNTPTINREAYTVNIPDVDPASVHITPPATSGARMYPMEVYQQAPYPGVLLNAEAIAFIQTEFTGQQQQCVIQRRAELGALSARAISDLEHYQARYAARQEESRILITGRDEELARMNRAYSVASSTPWSTYALLVGGGIILGFAGFSITYVATH